jgi:single-strand DNA-binding protein
MNGKNSVQLVGYVGQDLKRTKCDLGHRVAIRIATHHNVPSGLKGKENRTTWHNIVAWDQQAEFAEQNFVKGSKIMVEGRIVYGSFLGTDGLRRQTTHIRAHCLLNLDR